MITTLLLLINSVREPNISLKSDKFLITLAEQRCNSIKDFSHNDYYNIYSKQIEKKYKYTGEVLAADFLTAGSTVSAWIDSPTHKEIIKAKRYKYIGCTTCSNTVSENTTVCLFGGNL